MPLFYANSGIWAGVNDLVDEAAEKKWIGLILAVISKGFPA